jgi:hypothetical protein
MSTAQCPDDRETLVIGFAMHAAKAGWNETALRTFCARHGISAACKAHLWPQGVRTLGRQFNENADKRMLARYHSTSGHSLREVLLTRFEDNLIYKPAVCRLAASDLLHPWDTLLRTRETAVLMWACQTVLPRQTSIRLALRTWGLVLLYSLCVLIWVADGSVDQRATRRAVKLTSALLGAG